MVEDGRIARDDVEGIAILTIDRPGRRNALTRRLWLELDTSLREIASSSSIDGVIVTGAGDRAFASGADVAELVDRPPLAALDGVVQGILDVVDDLPVPTIAALNGHALGGGWELALACDLRVAVPRAKVGFPEVGLGILPGAGGIRRLLQHVGVGRAKEWILTGELLGAERAFELGLINRVVEPDRLLSEARALMVAMVAQPRLSVRLARSLIDAIARGDGSRELERLAYAMTFHAPDREERMRRFLDRPPRGDQSPTPGSAAPAEGSDTPDGGV